jgi:hypothetical protein
VSVLRRATTDAVSSLRVAASSTDAALDLALLRLGILAPADLDEIRSLLTRTSASLRATANHDGHRIIEVVERGTTLAELHHDGRIAVMAPAAA